MALPALVKNESPAETVVALEKDSEGWSDAHSEPEFVQVGGNLQDEDATGRDALEEEEVSVISGNSPNQKGHPMVLPIPEVRPSPYRFELLQQWEGTVTEIEDHKFEARLRDLTHLEYADEIATFSKEEVSEGDLSLLAKGAVFRWSIGYKTRRGQKERVAYISFLRLPSWSERALERVEETAEELEATFPLPSPDST